MLLLTFKIQADMFENENTNGNSRNFPDFYKTAPIPVPKYLRKMTIRGCLNTLGFLDKPKLDNFRFWFRY